MKNKAGLTDMESLNMSGFLEIESGGDELWISGKDGVRKILTPLDKKADFIVFHIHKCFNQVRILLIYSGPILLQMPN